MSEKTYVTIKEGQRMDLGVGNQQCFEHESSQPKTMPVYTLVKAYLALAEVQGTGLRYFKPIYDISYDHRSIRFSAVFQIGQGIGGHTFLMESVRDYELPLAWQKKLDEKLVPFASNAKHWHRYFEQEPIYLMLVENNDSALEAATLFYNRVEKTNFRLITDTEVLKGLDNAKFLKFAPGDRAEDGTPVTPGKLQATRIPLLSGGGSASQN